MRLKGNDSIYLHVYSGYSMLKFSNIKKIYIFFFSLQTQRNWDKLFVLIRHNETICLILISNFSKFPQNLLATKIGKNYGKNFVILILFVKQLSHNLKKN